jgi:hypothetical protein
MERNARIHPSDPGPDETRDDPIFPDEVEHDGVDEPEDDITLRRFDEIRSVPTAAPRHWLPPLQILG